MVKKNLSLFSLLFIVFLLVACSKDVLPNPVDSAKKYANLWESFEFEEMYDMLSEDTLSKFEEEDFIDRYEKVYKDLNITNLKVQLDDIEDDKIKEFNESGIAQFPIKVEMDSFAGPISFEHTLQLNLINNDNEEMNDNKEAEWTIDWDQTFIFPELDEDSKIRVETIEPRRGDILDRNKMPLAINDLAYEVGIIPGNIQDEYYELTQAASILNTSKESIENKLNASWVEDEHFVPIKTISNQDEESLEKLRQLPSVSLKETEGRHYPLGKAAAHLIGYVGQVTAEDLEKDEYKDLDEEAQIGKTGLEKQFEKQLRGEKGARIVAIDEFDREHVIAEKEVKHGQSIQLTIDSKLQEDLFNSYDDKTGTAVALHPEEGDLLALVSYPSFDPNDFTYGITEKKWEDLSNDKKQPLFNRFNAIFAPGSVIKPFTAVAGLNSGDITFDEGLQIDGLQWKKDSWKDAKITRVSTSNKPVDLEDALLRSDNIYFAMKSLDIGAKDFVTQFKAIGFEEKIPVDLNVKPSQISNDGHLNDELLLANTSYGQAEVEMSALHLATLYTMFINDGNVIKPKLYLDDKKEFWLEDVITKDEAKKLDAILRKVVTDGTAKKASSDDVTIAGKTGTVELKSSYDSDGQVNGWFVGYEQKDKDILIAMLVEDVEDKGSSISTETVYEMIKKYKKES